MTGRKGDWLWDITTDTVTWSEQIYRIAGCDPNVALPCLKEHSCFYTSESWDRLTAAVLEVLKGGVPYEIDLKMLRPDGTKRWVIGSGEAVRNANNQILQLRGTIEDITERKGREATESGVALRAAGNPHHLTSRLVNAHEEEKAMISKELTDDICQSLALVAAGIQQLVPTFPEHNTQELMRIEALWQRTNETLDKVYRLAQELHPAGLDVIRLAGAIRWLCREFSNRCKIHVEVSTSIPAEPDKRLALSMFRVCQEALRNVAKHSRAKNVEVELTRDSRDLLLRVSDDGVGFESEVAKRTTGFGFVSMKEQVHLIGGELAVWSQPSFGTRIEARAPLREPLQESGAA